MGRAPTRVARGGNLAMAHRKDGGIVFSCELGRGIGRGVVHDDDFIRLADGAGGFVDRLQGAAEASLLVVRRHDK